MSAADLPPDSIGFADAKLREALAEAAHWTGEAIARRRSIPSFRDDIQALRFVDTVIQQA